MGVEFHCLPLQGQGACMEKGKLLQSKADKAGDESPGEDCGPPQTVGVSGRIPVSFVPGKGTTDKIFVVWQLQEYLAANNSTWLL